MLSQRGVCSRREAEYFVQNGWLAIEGKVITEVGTLVEEDSRVELDPKARQYQQQLITVLINKPIGYVSAQAEKGYKPASFLVTPNNRQLGDREARSLKLSWPLKHLAPAGRLDIDSSGLLVLTQDGRIAKQLIAAKSNIEKEYLVRVDQKTSDKQIERLRHGLVLDNVQLAPAKVEMLDSNYFRMILTEGRKRQIRRMCELIGLKVVGLKRVRIGRVRLGALAVGKWRLLGANEQF